MKQVMSRDKLCMLTMLCKGSLHLHYPVMKSEVVLWFCRMLLAHIG